MRIYEGFDLARFKKHVEDHPLTEVIPVNKNANPWELYRYRREVMEGPLNGVEKATGSFDYGHVYRNNKGRYSLVGLAESDWKSYAN
jgi:hypothetical protein